MTREQILDWLDKNNRGFTQKDFELFEKFYKEATKELEKEADEYATENYERCIYDDVIGWETDYEARKQAYLASAEPREKRIAELEAQIEKMKSALIDIKSNTDDVNIEWQIKYLFDELEIKENE